ncbi:MAG TPA: hypothetical protein VFC67_14725 [Prolixibacteraceae bacterium]|nr:hypothetical protein [Prolixibacteraceae bacterium]
MNSIICRNGAQDAQKDDHGDQMAASISVLGFLAHRNLCAGLPFSIYSHEEKSEEYASINLIINKKILQLVNQKKPL